MIEVAISLLAIPVLFAFAEWRWGLLLCLATAILQDPLRKITPDQPVFFVVFVGIVFAAACLGAWARGVPLTPNSMFGRLPADRDAYVGIAAVDYFAGVQLIICASAIRCFR